MTEAQAYACVACSHKKPCDFVGIYKSPLAIWEAMDFAAHALHVAMHEQMAQELSIFVFRIGKA